LDKARFVVSVASENNCATEWTAKNNLSAKSSGKQ
jgi:hypothetical protein